MPEAETVRSPMKTRTVSSVRRTKSRTIPGEHLRDEQDEESVKEDGVSNWLEKSPNSGSPPHPLSGSRRLTRRTTEVLVDTGLSVNVSSMAR